MTFDELLKQKKADRNTLLGRRNAVVSQINDLANEFLRIRNLGDIDAATSAKIPELRREKIDLEEQADRMEKELRAADDDIAQLMIEIRVDAEADRLSNELHVTEAGQMRRAQNQENRMTTTTSVREPRTYSEERAKAGENSFLKDLFAAQIKLDPEATVRLQQHGQEMRTHQPALVERAVTTGGVAGFVPPEYMINLFAEYLRAGRPVANLCNSGVPLPATGMKVNIPRITTKTATGVQATQNTALSNQDIDDTLLEVPVVTIGGYVDVARQAIERGTLVEEITLTDLASDYAVQMDAQVLTGSGADGQHQGIFGTSGITSVTYTDTTPTIAELWPKLASAIGAITSTRFTGPTAIAMNPNLWAWITSILATDGRPFVGAHSPFNALGMTDGVDYATTSRELQNVPVILDGNIPVNLGASTNETVIFVGDFRDAFLMEDNGGLPVQLKFEIIDTLTTRLACYGYSAFTAARQPKAFSKITGTGLIVPTL